MNQVEMVPNYDETVNEPVALVPKLPVMLLNGAEGIGTGFSSVIPSFHHREVCDSMIEYVETGRPKGLRPFARHYGSKIERDRGKFVFRMRFEEIGEKIHITEIPRGYDAARVYRHLNKFIDGEFMKDFIDHTVDNDIKIELVFKRGQRPELEEVEKKMSVSSSLTPNYTLIGRGGVRIFKRPEEIIQIFTERRLGVVKRRHELMCETLKKSIRRNSEIIKFIREKEYEVATRSKNRRSFVEHLKKKKYVFNEELADMPVYRMTKGGGGQEKAPGEGREGGALGAREDRQIRPARSEKARRGARGGAREARRVGQGQGQGTQGTPEAPGEEGRKGQEGEDQVGRSAG